MSSMIEVKQVLKGVNIAGGGNVWSNDSNCVQMIKKDDCTSR